MSHPDEEWQDPKTIVDQLPYVNELMRVISSVNEAINQGKDGRDAAENLVSDLPFSFYEEIKKQIDIEENKYNNTVSIHNKYLQKGYTDSQKYHAEKAIHLAGKTYSRKVKMIVLSMLEKKGLLFKTRKALEYGSISLADLGETPDDE